MSRRIMNRELLVAAVVRQKSPRITFVFNYKCIRLWNFSEKLYCTVFNM